MYGNDDVTNGPNKITNPSFRNQNGRSECRLQRAVTFSNFVAVLETVNGVFLKFEIRSEQAYDYF